jgi:hypothetical protein
MFVLPLHSSKTRHSVWLFSGTCNTFLISITLTVIHIRHCIEKNSGVSNSEYYARFQVLSVVNMKITIFWDVMPCSLAASDRSYGTTYCLYFQHRSALNMEAVCFSKIFVTGYQMIQYDIPCHNDLRHSNGIKQNRSSIKV